METLKKLKEMLLTIWFGPEAGRAAEIAKKKRQLKVLAILIGTVCLFIENHPRKPTA